MIIATPAKTAEWESRETVAVAIATAAKTAEWARMPTPETAVV